MTYARRKENSYRTMRNTDSPSPQSLNNGIRQSQAVPRFLPSPWHLAVCKMDFSSCYWDGEGEKVGDGSC